ncbi:MAG: transcriptional regulator GcvA [Pseudomonadota bacterium]
MSDRLPPLTALRAFEAAARHMSFQRAAEELSVTPAALSFQIKNLEEHLGAPLFHRLNRAVDLTEAGRALLPDTSGGFELLRAAWRSARRSLDDTTLTITAGPAFTAKWLAPRMFSFAQAHPDIELRLAASLKMMDFVRDEVDIAIRFGTGERDRENGLHTIPLLEEWTTPMMHPDIAARVRGPEDLAQHPLIHDDSLAFLRPRPDWAAWLQLAGVEVDASHGTRFSQADHAVDMALEGAGVVLGRASLCERYLNRGRLIAPFPLALRVPAAYRIVCPEGSQTRPAIARFIAWTLAEIDSTSHLGDGRDLHDIGEAGA